MSCNDCGGADTTCSDCADRRIAVLEAQLAEATADRDSAIQVRDERWARHKTANTERIKAEEERDAHRAEVARLRAAIEPTAEVLREMIAAEWKVAAWWTAKAKATALLAALGGAMSRKSWVEVEEARLLETNTRERFLLGRAIRETIHECARQCEGEQYAAEAQLKILALLEPGDEGEAP